MNATAAVVLAGCARVRAARAYRRARPLVEPQARAPQALASGLVNSSTSDTAHVDHASQDVLTVDREAGRLRKMRARVLEAASLHTSSSTLRPAMVTLTYAREGEWSPRHLSGALKRCRQWLQRRGFKFRYVWTAELQERGVIHYHVIAWFPQGADLTPPFWDVQGWWPHGSSRSEWAENGVGYIAKYVSKIGSKDRLPMGARMHGSGGFSPEERKRMTWHGRPGWLRQLTGALQTVRRKQGGGWVQQFACGLKRGLHSPWIVLTVNPLRIVRRDSPTGNLADALLNLRIEHEALCMG